ncbi:hypothetical protein [Arthrobacter sp. SD76]|uniref:hypothetical protein n=1 Tax=Arthrobacter sp. SD76 TaxID=3415007 RepID=UPI003C70BF20
MGTPAPGDLVITAGHVGVYAGDGQVVSGGVDGYKTEVHSISWLSGASFVRVASSPGAAEAAATTQYRDKGGGREFPAAALAR